MAGTSRANGRQLGLLLRLWRTALGPLVAALILLAPPSAPAQVGLGSGETTPAEVELPSPLTPEGVRDIVSTLSDEQVRILLLERLDAVAREEAAATSGAVSLFETAQRIVGDTGESLSTAVQRSPGIPGGVGKGLAQFFEPRGWGGTLWLLAAIAIAIAAGLAAEFVIDWIARRWRDRVLHEQPEGLGGTLGLLLRRVVLDVAGLIAFYLVSKEVIRLLLSSTPPVTDGAPSFPDTEIAIFFIWWVIMLPRMFRALNRFLIAPNRPALRLVHTDDWTAKYMHRQMTIVFTIWGLMSFLIPFLASHGTPMGELRLGFWLNLVAFGILIYGCWRARPGLSMMMLGRDDDVTPAERKVARAYPYLCLGLIVITWLFVEALVSQRLFGFISTAVLTMVIILFTPTFDTAVRGLVRHLVPPMTGEGPLAELAHHRTKRSYVRIGRVVIAVALILFISWLWGLDLANFAASGLGAQVAGRLIEVTIILLTGYLVWELVSLWINAKLAAEQTAAGIDLTEEEPGGGEGGGAGGSRLATVLPLLLGSLKVAIAVIFGLIALGNLGIDITPLLAGAGIVGLAVGFGAQKLVTDVVSGIFFLVDDAFRTGEYVEIEGTVGTVEKISVRSMQLRHHRGPVHTIPYGEIPKISNYSRDWVIMKLKFTVPFETDPNKVKKLFKQIGKDMMAVPEFAADLLQPFKSQGVFDFDDVGMIIRGKFMAKPGRQFVLRKEIYNRVKQTFEEHGIAFARREVRVAIPGLEEAEDLTDEQKSAIASSAAQAVQDSLPDPGDTKPG
jgi:small-conductance mechanosensitive channel